MKHVQRTRQADGRWLTGVTIERKGDGFMPVEIGTQGRGGAADTVYARATGRPALERIEFTTPKRPGPLMLDPRVRAHDYNMLNNRERHGLLGGTGAWTLRIDDPFQEAARRDRGVRGLLPVLWSNDFGGVTVGLRERANYLAAYNRALLLGTVATRRGASPALGLYGNPGPGIVASSRYGVEAFGRVTGEASVRSPSWGARLFAGAYLGSSYPVRQRRISIAGADPYETFTNPFLRSQGALLVRPDFHYQAPGGANVRGFRPDLGGRWAVGLNLEATPWVLRRDQGILRRLGFEVFADGGVVDTTVIPSSPPGQWYTTVWDLGVGLVTRHQVKELAWTMRFEVPLAVNRWDNARDFAPGDKTFAFRWQVSLGPTF